MGKSKIHRSEIPDVVRNDGSAIRRDRQFKNMIVAFIGKVRPPIEMDVMPATRRDEGAEKNRAFFAVQATPDEDLVAGQHVPIL
jgi:hypothetical protein